MIVLSRNCAAALAFLSMAFLSMAFLCLACPTASAQDPWVVFEGTSGPGLSKKVVLLSGDEEYRSEEALPQLGKILATHHGFTCVVLFAVDPDGKVNPENNKNIPGLQHLQDADLMIIATRFRDLPDDQMKQIDDYLQSGRPVIGMRTATHAFNIPKNKPYAHYGNGYNGPKSEWKGGFGRLVLGEKWINHHGRHGHQGTGGLLAVEAGWHPIARGIRNRDVWGDTDVYEVRLPLPGDSQPIILGAVLQGMKPEDPPVEGKKNDPVMPVAWVKSYQLPGGRKGRAFTTTMGSASDLVSEGTRRMLVHAAFWSVGLEDQIPELGLCADLVGPYKPSFFGFGSFRKGLTPADFAK